MARRIVSVREGVIAVVIERVDGTCSVVGSGFALHCRSRELAIEAIGDMESLVTWSEHTPGFVVARKI
jgi:hypothetical protein